MFLPLTLPVAPQAKETQALRRTTHSDMETRIAVCLCTFPSCCQGTGRGEDCLSCPFFVFFLFFPSFSQLPAWRRWWFVISDRRCVIYDALVLSGRRDASAFLSLILGMRLLCFSVLFRLYKPSVVYWSSRLRIVFPLDIFVAGGARAKLRHLTTAEIAALYASAVAGSVTTRFRPPVAPV